MNGPGHTESEAALVGKQVGRSPREPWRVGARCKFGYPTVIVSPATLQDGTPFPTWAWLCCPWLVGRVSSLESGGAVSRWVARAAEDRALGVALRELSHAVSIARAGETGEADACSLVGVAGQRDPLGIKCLHAYVALSLAGLDNPVGAEVLAEVGERCPDARCETLRAAADSEAAACPPATEDE